MTTIDGPFGATSSAGGVHFRVFSGVADGIDVAIFDDAGAEARHPLTREPGGVWHAYVEGVGPGLGYGYPGRWTGVRRRTGSALQPAKLLLDPYAKAVSRQGRWQRAEMFAYPLGGDDTARDDTDSGPDAPRGFVVDDRFDWGTDGGAQASAERVVIYELHVKGFTMRHPGVPEPLRGRYMGLAHPEAIAALLRLGVTTVELMPVQQFAHEPHLQEAGRRNYWGYQPYAYFAPHAEYASDDRGSQVTEFKAMVKALHAAGLEVIIDVVYNHTAEGNHLGPTLSFRGLDNPAVYHLVDDDARHYMDYTGTGNSLNLRHPDTLQLVMDSLRYWVSEMHVDGFRFDLATTLARGRGSVDTWAAFLRDDPSGSVAPARQAHRRTVGRRHQWLPGRKFSAPLVGVERPLSRDGAAMLERGLRRRRAGAADDRQSGSVPADWAAPERQHQLRVQPRWSDASRPGGGVPASRRQPGGAKPPSARSAGDDPAVDGRADAGGW